MIALRKSEALSLPRGYGDEQVRRPPYSPTAGIYKGKDGLRVVLNLSSESQEHGCELFYADDAVLIANYPSLRRNDSAG